jgi:hypothetical protein
VAVVCRVWGSAALIETDNAGDATNPQLATDANGNAVAVWQQSDGIRTNIRANRYLAGSGWLTPILIETDDAGDATNPQVAIDANGNAMTVWQQSDGTRTNIWANRYLAGSGWLTPILIETDNSGDATNPQVAVDANGDAVAVWTYLNGAQHEIWANHYTAGWGWGTATAIGDNTGDAGMPDAAVDGNGDAVAVWQQSDGIRTNIWANRYTLGSGWGTATLIENDNTGAALNPRIAIDSGGDAVAVWQQSDGTRINILANRYAAGSGWGDVALIESDNSGDAANPMVAIDNDGNAVTVWQQSDATRTNIWANRYAAGSGWGGAALIETDDAGDAANPMVAIDNDGNAVAVWQQSDATRTNIWTNRYAAGGNWDAAILIESDNNGAALNPQASVGANADVVVVWQQSDGSRSNIWANVYRQ